VSIAGTSFEPWEYNRQACSLLSLINWREYGKEISSWNLFGLSEINYIRLPAENLPIDI
jgi:hypothetical protein